MAHVLCVGRSSVQNKGHISNSYLFAFEYKTVTQNYSESPGILCFDDSMEISTSS